ncbi:golgin subfamily A member 2-like isoform X2 [Lathamus discolor]|uniref:golgin subfamily A member 2-like isoform X2 n=1 Tax=Lathamus discolor TaxID=678569 RepID=UPI0032B799EB
MRAVEFRHEDCVATLLELGARTDLRDFVGNTALHLATLVKNKRLVELLLEHSAHIDAVNELGQTPLAEAVCMHCEEIVELLLQKGADVNARCKSERIYTYLKELTCDKEFSSVQECSAHEKDDSTLTSEIDPEAPGKESAGVLLPDAGRHKEEDCDSWFDSKIYPEAPGKESAGVLLPDAGRHTAEIWSPAEHHSNGVLLVAEAQEEEDCDSWFDSKIYPEAPGKESAGVLLPDAGRHTAEIWSPAEHHSNGILPAARAEQDVNSLFEPVMTQVNSEIARSVSAIASHPAGGRLRVGSKSVVDKYYRAPGAEKEEDFDSVLEPAIESKNAKSVSAVASCPAGGRLRVGAKSVADKYYKGILPDTGAEQEEKHDSSSDSHRNSSEEGSVAPLGSLASGVDSEAPGKESGGVLLPNVNGHTAETGSLPEQQSNGVLPVAGAENKEDSDFFSKNEFSLSEGEQLQLKKHASTQTGYPREKQRWVRQLQQELANALRKNSLAEASLEAEKRYSRDQQEQKLQLQKELDRSKAKLQELKEQCIQTKCYAKFLKNASENKDRELTAYRVLQGLLPSSSGTVAMPELEECIQCLQVVKAQLEATVQQQAKATEALQEDLQASALGWSGRKEVQKLAQLEHQLRALLDNVQRRNVTLLKERASLKMLLEKSQEKTDGIGGESLLSFQGEMKDSCSPVANKVGELRKLEMQSKKCMQQAR